MVRWHEWQRIRSSGACISEKTVAKPIDEIAATFGITEITVKQRLALANLLPKIKDAYRAEEIDDATIRHLTLATKGQQPMLPVLRLNLV
jgi:predicted transcriptional regulator